MDGTDSQPTAIPPAELECYRDAEWAMRDSNVQESYRGQWVVAHKRQIIAHGTDPKAVAEQAQLMARGLRHRLVLCVKEDSKSWLKQTIDRSVDLFNA